MQTNGAGHRGTDADRVGATSDMHHSDSTSGVRHGFADAGATLRRNRLAARVRRAGRASLLVLPELLAVLVLVLALWFNIAVTVAEQFDNAQRTAAESTASTGRAVEEGTRRIVGEVNQTLLTLRASYATAGSHLNLRDWMRAQALADRLVPQIAIVDRDGWIVSSTFAPVTQPISLADRPHFTALRDSAEDILYISAPVIGRLTGLQTIQFARRLTDRNGAFDGIAVVSLDCRELADLYESVGTEGTSVTLTRSDGTVLARVPHRGGPPSITPAVAPPPADPADHLSMAFRGAATSGIANGDQIVSYRQLTPYPLFVTVEVDRALVFSRYYFERTRLLMMGAAATGIVLLLAHFWIAQRQRSIATKRALAATVGAVRQGVVMIDQDGRIPVINDRAVEMLGLSCDAGAGGPLSDSGDRSIEPHDLDAAMRGANWRIGPDQPPLADGQARPPADGPPVPRNGRIQVPSSMQTVEAVRSDGRTIEITRLVLPDGGMVQTYTDVTARHAAEAQIRHAASHDQLTNLPNRARLKEELACTARSATPDGRLTAVLLIDLDGFKRINDTLGHQVGDEVLVVVAEQLRAAIRPGDFVARMGGDEFVVLIPQLDSEEDAVERAQSLLQRISRPVVAGGRELAIGACIGLVICPLDGEDGNILLKNADIALYSAKAAGGGVAQRFSPDMVRALEERHLLEADLRKAAEERRFELVYQPQFDAETLKLTGFEALLRWWHPTRGLVSAADFIPLAEECGLVGGLGRWGLERVCAEAASWPLPCRVAYNLSPSQLKDSDFPAFVAATLAASGLDPARLELEITENVLVDDAAQVLHSLHELKQLGITLALDDFGTGYSSLGYLVRLPIDRVKIDKTFVQRQTHDSGAQAIVEAILTLATRFNLEVVAEGVETDLQLAMLRKQGCMQIQGFLLGCPMSVAAIRLDLAERSATPDHGHAVASVIPLWRGGHRPKSGLAQVT